MTDASGVSAPSSHGPRYEVMDVTPSIAQTWLESNTHNRHARDNKVAAYARDMAAGAWTQNGESIKFAADGTLLDGQHRLMAVVESKTTVPMLIVFDLANEAQETMDAGAKRTLADALALRGEKNGVNLGATLKRALLWNRGITNFKSTGYVPTAAECLRFLAAEPRIRDSAEVGSRLSNATSVTPVTLAFTHWLFAAIDIEDAAWFFTRLSTGAGLEQYHPVLTLRKRFAEDRAGLSRMPEEMAIALMIKGWNAFRAGDQIRILRFTPGGANAEKFPMPK